MVHQIIHMEQLRLDLPLVVVVRARSRGTHLDDGTWEQSTEFEDVLAKAFEVKPLEAEAPYAHFEEFLRCR